MLPMLISAVRKTFVAMGLFMKHAPLAQHSILWHLVPSFATEILAHMGLAQTYHKTYKTTKKWMVQHAVPSHSLRLLLVLCSDEQL